MAKRSSKKTAPTKPKARSRTAKKPPFERLRAEVRQWYREEAARLAADFETHGKLDRLDFAELVRRSQAMLACEMTELLDDKPNPAAVAPDSPDYAQLERVARAMQAQGKEVPDSIRKMLEQA